MRVIAVDDEPLALQDLMGELSRALPADCERRGFAGAGEALALAAEAPVDVAFLDVELRGMNGLELARRLKAIRGETNVVFVTAYPQYAADAFSIFASGFLLKPVTSAAIAMAMEHLRHPLPGERETGLRVRTFGNFEVYLDGEPLRFARSKAKELFAYLIHKRGTGCSTRELAAILFEDRPYTLSLQKQVQTILSSMMRTLRDAGRADCVVRGHNRTAVAVERIENCDYYRFLGWDAKAINEYRGEYMANYSWAEFVVGYLDSRLV